MVQAFVAQWIEQMRFLIARSEVLRGAVSKGDCPRSELMAVHEFELDVLAQTGKQRQPVSGKDRLHKQLVSVAHRHLVRGKSGLVMAAPVERDVDRVSGWSHLVALLGRAQGSSGRSQSIAGPIADRRPKSRSVHSAVVMRTRPRTKRSTDRHHRRCSVTCGGTRGSG
jgi:hypothetical protein